LTLKKPEVGLRPIFLRAQGIKLFLSPYLFMWLARSRLLDKMNLIPHPTPTPAVGLVTLQHIHWAIPKNPNNVIECWDQLSILRLVL
jgi:hypothetical protein